ncbi:MAG: EF-hand domain-containing protein [Steroidobacteraceae bacterium]
MKMSLPIVCFVLACGAYGALSAQTVRSELKPVAFGTLDTNKDGKLSLKEARAEPDLEMAFEMLDLNHDGFLSPAEFQAWPRALRIKDAVVRDPTTAPSGSAGSQHMSPTN